MGIAELHRPVAEIKQMGMSLGNYGMGWISQECGASRIVWHSGIVPDFGGFMALLPEQKKGLILLYNVNHAMMKLTFDKVGMGAAQRLAGEPHSRPGVLNGLMPAMLLIPILQIADIVTTLQRLHRWRVNPTLRPNQRRLWRQHIILPLLANLIVALTLIPLLGNMRGFIKLFMPDFSWLAQVCGSLGLLWGFLRSGLTLRAVKVCPPPSQGAGQSHKTSGG
jgi:hypothetical protein